MVERVKRKSRIEKARSSNIDLAATAREPGHASRAVAPKLARPGEPYVMLDGKVVPPEHIFAGEKHLSDQVKSSKDYRPQRKRAARELAAAPNVMKGVLLVFGFTVLGVSDREIAEMLGITLSQVRAIREHTAYGESFEVIATEFVNARSKRLVSRIAAYADQALETVVDIATTGKESNRLKAATDILDRAGVRPKDTEQMGRAQQNELRITILKGDGTENVMVDDMAIEEV